MRKFISRAKSDYHIGVDTLCTHLDQRYTCVIEYKDSRFYSMCLKNRVKNTSAALWKFTEI